MSDVPGLASSRYKVEVTLWVDAPTLRLAAVKALMDLRDMPPSLLPNVRVTKRGETESVEIDPGSMSDTGGWAPDPL